jgi:hypothetical protein
MHGDGDRWAQVSLRSGCDPWTSTAGLHGSWDRVWTGTRRRGRGKPSARQADGSGSTGMGAVSHCDAESNVEHRIPPALAVTFQA